jgi:hypothetical protein
MCAIDAEVVADDLLQRRVFPGLTKEHVAKAAEHAKQKQEMSLAASQANPLKGKGKLDVAPVSSENKEEKLKPEKLIE